MGQRIQGKCGYLWLCYTLNALLPLAVCSAQDDALLGIVSSYIGSWADLYKVQKILLWLKHIEFKANVVIFAYTRQRKSYNLTSVRTHRIHIDKLPYCKYPTLYSIMFCSGKEMRLFKVQHSEQVMQLYKAIRSAPLQILALTREPSFV